MRHSLLILLSLAMCGLLPTEELLVADDPPSVFRTNFAQRTNYAELSLLVQSSPWNSHAAASCASTACHGGPRPGIAQATASRGAEYPLWLERDPHAQAYQSLSNELGTRILQQLNILEGSEIKDRNAFNNCLACHNSTEQASVSSTNALRLEGVACDRCHGPSQLWRNTHYTQQWNSIIGPSMAHDVGFVVNQDLLTRARMCATCHVGDARRNVNHDMIAAGHPPLFYEFTTYHNRLPKHWRDPRARDAENYESTLWLVGQIAALEAQAAWIKSRAEAATTGGTWPEFAHLDCSGCHQPLTAKLPTTVSSSRARWSRWQRWGVETILAANTIESAESLQSPSAIELRQAIANLDELLQNQASSPRQVGASTGELQAAINRWVTAPDMQASLQKFSSSQLGALLDTVTTSLENSASAKPNWETLSQLYLAGVATRGRWPHIDRNAKSFKDSTYSIADELRRELLFSPDKTVPHFQVSISATNDAMALLKTLQSSSMPSTLKPSSSMRSKP